MNKSGEAEGVFGRQKESHPLATDSEGSRVWIGFRELGMQGMVFLFIFIKASGFLPHVGGSQVKTGRERIE